MGERNRAVAAMLLFVAAGIHVLAAYEPLHLETQLFYVFWGVVFAQVLAGALILLRIRWGAGWALLVNAVLILAYALTRLFPLTGEEMPEPVELLGVLSKAVELVSLPVLVVLFRTAPGRATAGSPAEPL